MELSRWAITTQVALTRLSDACTTAGGSDERDVFSLVDTKGHVVERVRHLLPIAERHVRELDVALEVARIEAARDAFWLRIEHGLDTLIERDDGNRARYSD